MARIHELQLSNSPACGLDEGSGNYLRTVFVFKRMSDNPKFDSRDPACLALAKTLSTLSGAEALEPSSILSSMEPLSESSAKHYMRASAFSGIGAITDFKADWEQIDLELASRRAKPCPPSKLGLSL